MGDKTCPPMKKLTSGRNQSRLWSMPRMRNSASNGWQRTAKPLVPTTNMSKLTDCSATTCRVGECKDQGEMLGDEGGNESCCRPDRPAREIFCEIRQARAYRISLSAVRCCVSAVHSHKKRRQSLAQQPCRKRVDPVHASSKRVFHGSGM